MIFGNTVVEIADGLIAATFADGKTNDFYLSALADDEGYKRIARWAGYGGDWQRYGIEHEVTHHWLAARLGWDWSWSLHDNPPMPWPAHVAWEEHVVNACQRFLRAEVHDPFRQIDRLFGSDLDEALNDLRQTLEAIP